jgi:hypothetical protein
VNACAVTRAQRVQRALLAVAAAAFAVYLGRNQPWCAVPAAMCSVLLAVGAITGWCPTNLFQRRASLGENSFGYPVAIRDPRRGSAD